jgi:hypothetical protein
VIRAALALVAALSGPADAPATTAPFAASAMPVPAPSRAGIASWYAYHEGQAAAGPALRAFLGPDWRGQRVTVNGLTIRLTDWCQCYEGTARERIIDLDRRDFAKLAPISRGLIRVTVGRP